MLNSELFKSLIFEMLFSIAINNYKLEVMINNILHDLNNICNVNRWNDINNEVLKEIIHKVQNVLHFNTEVFSQWFNEVYNHKLKELMNNYWMKQLIAMS